MITTEDKAKQDAEAALASIPRLARVTLRNSHVEEVYTDGIFILSLKGEYWHMNGDYSPDTVDAIRANRGPHRRDIIMVEGVRTRSLDDKS